MATRISNVSADLSATVGTTTLTIVPRELVSITVFPASATISDSGTQQYSAMGTYNDNTVEDLTNQVLWISSNTSVAYFDDQAYPTGTAIARAISWFSATVYGNLNSTAANLSLLQSAITPYGPSSDADPITNIDYNSEYWRIYSTTGGTYHIAVRYSGTGTADPGYPSASLYGFVPDSRMWLVQCDAFGVTSTVQYNDDAEGVLNGWPAPLSSSFNGGGSNYWSYIQFDMEPYRDYWLEISSFSKETDGGLNFGEPGTYQLQFAKLAALQSDVDIQIDQIFNPYYGYYVNSQENSSTTEGNLGAVAFSASSWWYDNINNTWNSSSPIAFDIFDIGWNSLGGAITRGPYPPANTIDIFNLGFVTASTTSSLNLGTATVYGNDFATSGYIYYMINGEGDNKIRVQNLEFANSGALPPTGTYRILVVDSNGGETLTNFTFDLVAEPPKISGLAGFVISGNPNYALGTSSVSYLEGYPMWKGTNAAVYMTASTATPDPPKTGHAAFGYNSSTGRVVVSSSATTGNYMWNGTYNNAASNSNNGAPWQKYGYPNYNPGAWFMTKGYAGSDYAGPANLLVTSTWLNVYDAGIGGFQVDTDTGLTFPTGTSYYAQTQLFEDFYPSSNNTVTLETNGGGNCDRVMHVIAYGPAASGVFSDLTGVYIYLRDNDAVGSNSLPYKKINNSELLCWLPNNRNPTYWPDFFNPGAVVLRFTTSSGSWDSSAPFYVATYG